MVISSHQWTPHPRPPTPHPRPTHVSGERFERRLFSKDFHRRIYESNLLRPVFMKEAERWKVYDLTLFSARKTGSRATYRMIRAFAEFAHNVGEKKKGDNTFGWPGSSTMRKGFDEMLDNTTTVWVRVTESPPAEPVMMSPPEHREAVLADVQAALDAKVELHKEAKPGYPVTC